MPQDKYTPPDESFVDHGHKLLRSGLGAIPFAGTAAIELFSTVLAPPFTKRNSEWMSSMANGLRTLEENGRIVQARLAENEAFVDVFLGASRISVQTSNTAKREYLKNAVLNAAVDQEPDEALQQIYLDLLLSLTDWHLKALTYYQAPSHLDDLEPNADGAQCAIACETGFLVEYPELKKRPEFTSVIIGDLYRRQLITRAQVMEKTPALTTALGDGLLAFIQSPVASGDAV